MDDRSQSLRQRGLGQSLDYRMGNVEDQVDLHTSHLESESGTRVRAHKALHERLDKQDARLARIEKTIWMLAGALALLKLLADKVIHV